MLFLPGGIGCLSDRLVSGSGGVVEIQLFMADDRGGTLDLRKVESEIRGIKGIGEKRAEEIMLIFELRFMICASAVFSGMIMHNQQYQDGSLFIRWLLIRFSAENIDFEILHEL